MTPSLTFVSHPLNHRTCISTQIRPQLSSRRPTRRFSTHRICAKANSGDLKSNPPPSNSKDPFSSLAAGPSSRTTPRISRPRNPTEQQTDSEEKDTTSNTQLEADEASDQKTPPSSDIPSESLRAVRALGKSPPEEKPFLGRKTAADFIAEGVVDDVDESSTLPVSDIQFGIDDIKDPFKQEVKEQEEEKMKSEKEIMSESIGQVVDVTGDGSVKKTLLTAGTGEAISSNAKVIVDYTGKLEDGTIFDSSRERDSFSFQLGTGTVIKGWESAVATMRVGEVAEFTIAPMYAYGKRGMPPVIPGNATLTFEINLLEAQGEELKEVKKVSDFNTEIPRTPQDIARKYEMKMDAASNEKKSFFERFYFISPFMSQTGEKPPWWINPNITFTLIGLFTVIGFYFVYISGAIHIGYVDETIDVNIFK